MKFEDVRFQKDGKSRRFEDLSEEEKEALRKQIYKQRKEEFEKNWGFEK